MDTINFNFLCNNAKRFQTSKKRLKYLTTSKIKYFPMVLHFILTRNALQKGERK